MTRPALLWLAIAVALSALGGCRAHQGTRLRSNVETEAGQFVFEYQVRDRETRQQLEAAIQAASPRLAEWGGLVEPVNVFIMPTHEALEDAVNRRGYDWLRAWARYDEIFLQSPRTWSVFRTSQSDIDELMLHELTHTVMYQQASDRMQWSRKGIPLWFREGMASWTARQGYRWPTLEDLARYYERAPDSDPVGLPEPLYQSQSKIVYGAAHHAFTFLVNRYGTAQVRGVLTQMRQGHDFRKAFVEALGLSPEAFVNDFKRYVQLRGFKGSRRIKRMRPAAPVQLPPPSPQPAPPAPEPMPEPQPLPPPPSGVPAAEDVAE